MFFKAKKEEIHSPINGMIRSITEAPDPVFAQKMMGEGFCVEPTDGIVVSPVDGKVATVFPTKHAIGLTTKKGTEIIIHFGMETVSLNGEGFASFVETGQSVKVGDKLLEVDIDKIKDKVPSLVTPVVISNSDGKTITLEKEGNSKQGDVILTVK